MRPLLKTLVIIAVLFVTSCSSTKNSVSSERDGSTFEKAVKVKNIGEEYEYIKKVCVGCQLNSQGLVFENDKPYDIITLTNPNGETVSYYFDISKFYGKRF